MKLHERINCILLGTLWCLAVVLVLDFWLNTTYNFDMFSSRHWHFVAELQAAHKPIYSGFYISMVLAVLICFFGLFLLLRPKFRKIILKKPETKIEQKPVAASQNIPQKPVAPEKPLAQPELPAEPMTATEPAPREEPVSATEPETQPTLPQSEVVPSIERPPHLHIQPGRTVTPPKRTTPVAKPTPQVAEARYTHEIREIFERNDYKVLQPKTVAGVPLSLVALGTHETLWIGACDISHEKMADVIFAFKSIFQETLEDLEIDVNAFIINPLDNDQVEAILDVESLDDLGTAIDKIPNEPESQADVESGNMDAFAGYIETVLTYLGNK